MNFSEHYNVEDTVEGGQKQRSIKHSAVPEMLSDKDWDAAFTLLAVSNENISRVKLLLKWQPILSQLRCLFYGIAVPNGYEVPFTITPAYWDILHPHSPFSHFMQTQIHKLHLPLAACWLLGWFMFVSESRRGIFWPVLFLYKHILRLSPPFGIKLPSPSWWEKKITKNRLAFL